jgi:hypothetical protein
MNDSHHYLQVIIITVVIIVCVFMVSSIASVFDRTMRRYIYVAAFGTV